MDSQAIFSDPLICSDSRTDAICKLNRAFFLSFLDLLDFNPRVGRVDQVGSPAVDREDVDDAKPSVSRARRIRMQNVAGWTAPSPRERYELTYTDARR